jgi:hypothetical protein
MDYCFTHEVGVIALTDNNHNTLPLAQEAVENLVGYSVVYADDLMFTVEDQTGQQLYFLKGLEVHHQGPHIIGIGYDGTLKERSSVDDYVKEFDGKGGIVIMPHLANGNGVGEEFLRRLKEEDPELFDVITAFEGFNSQIPRIHEFFFDTNKKARTLANELGKPAIAVADSHDEKVDRAYIDMPNDSLRYDSGRSLVDSIKRNIETGNYENRGENISARRFLRVYVGGNLQRKLKFGF